MSEAQSEHIPEFISLKDAVQEIIDLVKINPSLVDKTVLSEIQQELKRERRSIPVWIKCYNEDNCLTYVIGSLADYFIYRPNTNKSPSINFVIKDIETNQINTITLPIIDEETGLGGKVEACPIIKRPTFQYLRENLNISETDLQKAYEYINQTSSVENIIKPYEAKSTLLTDYKKTEKTLSGIKSTGVSAFSEEISGQIFELIKDCESEVKKLQNQTTKLNNPFQGGLMVDPFAITPLNAGRTVTSCEDLTD